MINWINKKRNKKGFTLVELVVVIAILGILAAIAIPRFTNQTQEAKKVADEATARNIIGAINVAVAAGDAVIDTDGIFIKASADAALDTTGTPLNSTTGTPTILANLKALSYMDEVPTPQSGGEKFIITVANSALTITNDVTPNADQFYPVQTEK